MAPEQPEEGIENEIEHEAGEYIHIQEELRRWRSPRSAKQNAGTTKGVVGGHGDGLRGRVGGMFASGGRR